MAKRDTFPFGVSGPLKGATNSAPPSSNTPDYELSDLLGIGERGGVVAPSLTLSPREDGFNVESVTPVDEGLLRVALLFVDVIDLPCNNHIGFHHSMYNDVTGIGLGVTSVARYPSHFGIEEATTYAWNTFRELDKREPGRWSLWQSPGTNIIPGAVLDDDLALQTGLRHMLMVPDPSLPFEDVITFKQRHKDELIALRTYLEELSRKTAESGNPHDAHRELELLDQALADYTKKAKQSNIKKFIASITTELDLSAAVRSMMGAGSGSLVSLAANLTLTNTALAIGGGVLASLSVKSSPGLKKADPSPFRYIARMEREFGG